jgi:lipoyl(octanoyl) transferase
VRNEGSVSLWERAGGEAALAADTPRHRARSSQILAERRLDLRDLGLVDYAAAIHLQDELVEQRRNNEIPDTLLLLEHPPVITLGRRATFADVYISAAALAQRGIQLAQTTRGGLVTYHGPGQVVGYPIVELRARALSVPCYVRALELAIIAALADVGVQARIDEGHVGVWTDQGKIAAIGVAQRHGVTLHGFAVNLQPDLAHFLLINPCGIGDLGVTSAQAILGHSVDPEGFNSAIAEALEEQLELVSCRRLAAAGETPAPGR